MNTIASSIYVFKKKVRGLPVDSKERTLLIDQLFSSVECCLVEQANGPAKDFLYSRYVCPINYLPQQEINLKKMADSIARAIIEPSVVKTLRLAVVPDQLLQSVLLGLCKKNFGKYLKVKFRIIQGQSSLDFIAAA